MLEATKSLMFRSTALSSSLKSLSQPRDLTTRESKQLLGILTKSFRQQLEREHGNLFRLEGEVRSETKVDINPTSKPSRRQAHPDILLKSILTHPLLSQSTGNSNDGPIARDPVEIFDDAVSKGLMNLNLAEKCLVSKKRLIIQSSNPSIRDGMKASGLGRKVLKWMLSTNIKDDIVESAFSTPKFSSLFSEFLVAENLNPVLWTWLERLSQEILESRKDRINLARKLVLKFVQAQMRIVSPESGLATLVAAGKTLNDLKSGADNQRILCDSAGLLLRDYALKSPQLTTLTDASSFVEDYESFIALLSTWNCPLATATLWLNHPTKPDPSLALNYLKTLQHPANLRDLQFRDGRLLRVWGHQSIPILGVSIARHLLEANREVDARWVMNLLQNNYGDTIGMTPAVEQVKAEAASLELLENLQLT